MKGPATEDRRIVPASGLAVSRHGNSSGGNRAFAGRVMAPRAGLIFRYKILRLN